MTGSPAGMNSAIWMRHDIERELQRVDWADVGIRLTAYATWKACNLHWRTGRTDVLAGGKPPAPAPGCRRGRGHDARYFQIACAAAFGSWAGSKSSFGRATS